MVVISGRRSVERVRNRLDPLAEYEAWNKVKESSVVADYHAFLKQFSNGSLVARAVSE